MLRINSRGSFKNTEQFLAAMQKLDIPRILESAGSAGVAALRANTPVDSGLVAQSWDYTVSSSRRGHTITWINTDIENGFPVAISLQYGYGTGTGGYVSGRDYINPVIRPLFEKIAADVWKAVSSA